MKKSILVLSLCVLSAHLLTAQVKVGADGKVGIQIGALTPLSTLSVGNAGSISNRVNIDAPTYICGLSINRTGTNSYGNLYGTLSSSEVTSSKSTYGIGGYNYAATLLGSGRSWGVFGYAGNASTGYNYGVMGVLTGTGYGAGIVGTINGNQDVNVPGIYAGYFVGDVKVTGLVTSSNITSSDRRLKKNIEKINLKRNALDGVLSLNPVEYNLSQRYIKAAGDSASVQKPYYDEKSQLYQKKQFGLIAQEVQAVYPDLVYEDQEGYLAVNYTGIIPLLIESIKDLKAEVDALKKEVSAGKIK
ncbi:MAG: tail fiber domain-containing protein [Paludibacter sp.]|nr:tail fiber domain-containing protein [Paludibacter sp.]